MLKLETVQLCPGKIYQYHPSSPLTFQAGDIVGYNQPRVPTSKLEFYLEDRQGQQ